MLPGATSVETPAISIELAVTEVADAVSESEQGGGSEASAASDGGLEAEAPEEKTETAEAEPAETGRQPPLQQDTPSQQDVLVAPNVTAPTPHQANETFAELASHTVKAPPDGRANRARPANRPKAVKSIASARGGFGVSSGKVSARTGAANSYKNIVQARVAANRPGVAVSSGRVEVAFGVNSAGGLAYARIIRSSGNTALNQSALGAVRRAAPFPPPPPGADRSFTMPFTFNKL